MELSDYLRVLRAHWIGVLALTLLGLALAAGYTVTQPKVYAANANGSSRRARPVTRRWPR